MTTIYAEPETLEQFQREIQAASGHSAPAGSRLKTQDSSPLKLALDKDKVEAGLAKLVLTLIELLRRLMEDQAIKRMEAGSLSDQQIEDLGETFLKLEEKMQQLKAYFGLQDEELNLNLGPLGNLM